MNIQIIGYKNHALRLEGILKKLGHQEVRTFNYHTDDISKLVSSDIFFIATPNKTHVEWIENIRRFGQDKYIFCEKPPASDSKQLSKISRYDPKIFFNFNYRYSLLSRITKGYLKTGELGKLVYASFISSHGLAFKKTYKENWRFKSEDLSSSILGNVGIHYIDLISYLFGEINNIKVLTRNVVSKALPDSAYISVESELCSSRIFISYAAPFKNEATIIFDNGIIELVNGKVTIQSPRDVFDRKKMFKPAKLISVKPSFGDSRSYYNDSLINSINYFFDHVYKDKAFPSNEYEKAIRSNQFVLDQLS